MLIDFKYSIRDDVIIKVYGLDAEGKIVRLEYNGIGNVYEVEYALNSEIKRGYFYEDELDDKSKMQN